MDNEKPICFQNEFDEVVSLFKSSIDTEMSKHPEININVDKVIQEFENILLENLNILKQVEENQQNKDINAKIEAMQTKALNIKTNLQSHRAMFIENIRTQIENELNENRLRIQITDVPKDEDEDSNPELIQSLNLLDSSIQELQQKVNDTQKAMQANINKYETYEKTVSSSLSDV
ncbi:hypothetical protein TRFO_26903 [Tritrichomonas foetus]|uniref:Uncharacterized protein n=1 Tax=Tritrichomonas foetus TaxID=1144522 RepID=A0A1J4K1Z9_9EUKA|nr:hypothetical protein TRFO_26903 [Tritrichomonas foetus]|eukprot:OHT05415.1 hypothetical protein TRFO_26903 [Tritrichomonas foetus]